MDTSTTKSALALIMAPIVERFLEMTTAKEEWIQKITQWQEEYSEGKGITVLFEESMPDSTTGHFYRELNLAQGDVNHHHSEGTQVELKKFSVFIQTKVKFTPNGEFYHSTVVYLSIVFRSTRQRDSVRDTYWPGELTWNTPLFHTYLNWQEEPSVKINGAKNSKKGAGFAATVASSTRSSYSQPGWVMTFDNEQTRKLIIKKLKEVETCLKSVTPRDVTKQKLLYKK